MGVPGLWKEIQAHGTDTALARLSEIAPASTTSTSTSTSHSVAKTLRLGIDVSSWLYHANKSVGGYNSQLRLLFYRLCRLLAVPHVLPIFVFDGSHRPKEKRGSTRRSYKEAPIIEDLKKLIVAFGFVVHDALGEAEAELASLNARGALDVVMSDDVDSFVFGAKIVVRNWGQELSGAKARTEFVADRSSSEGNSSLSGEETPRNSQAMSAKDRHALGSNLITYFNASDLNQEGLTLGGLILIAILSGGDYDVKGLPRCGVKISTALAKAGLGDSLLEGVKKNCKPPTVPSKQVPSKSMSSPELLRSWPAFLTEWLTSVRHELSTNESGHLGRRFKKLADSQEFAELLSTKASLCVLGSYVWPLTTKTTPSFAFGSIDLAKIGSMCQNLFRWTALSTLDTMRNNLWEGCVVRELLGDAFDEVAPRSSQSKASTKASSSKDKGVSSIETRISNFFPSKSHIDKGSVSTESVTNNAPSMVILIASHRESGSTGYVKEVRAVCNVCQYVNLAKEGLDFNLTVTDLRGEDELPSPSQEAPVSPRKRKPFEDPTKELRLWISTKVIESNDAACKVLQAYQDKAQTKSRDGQSQVKKKSTGQERLDRFFVGRKADVSSSQQKQQQHLLVPSPSKKRSPPLSSSLTSLSSSCLESDSVSAMAPTLKAKKAETVKKTSPKKVRGRENVSIAKAPEWNTSILDYSDEEVPIGPEDSSIGDFSLPDIILPKRIIIPSSVDNSVEFVGIQSSPIRRSSTRSLRKASLRKAIEVSDESDQET